MRTATLIGLLALACVSCKNQRPRAVPDAPINLNFVAGSTGKVPPGWSMRPTGHSAELQRTGCHAGAACTVIVPPPKLPAQDGFLYQRFSARSYRGSSVRMAGWLRLDPADGDSQVRMWLRVSRPNHQQGFMDTMEMRPVRSAEWTPVEIVAKVASDADYVDIAITTVGRARAWADDISFTIVDSHTPLTAIDPETTPLRAAIRPPESAAFIPIGGITALPAVSQTRNEWKVAFSAQARDGKARLWVRPIHSESAQPLAGTEDASLPFWSPDNMTLGFFAGGKLSRIDAAGGPVLALADAGDARGASWSPWDVILFAPNTTGNLRKVQASGGTVSDASRLYAGENTHCWPSFLPDGRHFLFAAGVAATARKAIRLGSLDSVESTKLVDEADSGAVFSAGYLLFLRGDTLMAQPFDSERLRLSGEAVPAVEHVQGSPAFSLGAFSASWNGVLAYALSANSPRENASQRLEVIQNWSATLKK
jgi:hypothetical protein